MFTFLRRLRRFPNSSTIPTQSAPSGAPTRGHMTRVHFLPAAPRMPKVPLWHYVDVASRELLAVREYIPIMPATIEGWES